MQFTARQGRLNIYLKVFRLGRDLQVLCGGGASHIGAVALAAPAQGYDLQQGQHAQADQAAQPGQTEARLLALPANAKGAICVMGMGEAGAISRVALPCAGSCLVYGSLDHATAPGQLSCRELSRELVRWGARKRG